MDGSHTDPPPLLSSSLHLSSSFLVGGVEEKEFTNFSQLRGLVKEKEEEEGGGALAFASSFYFFLPASFLLFINVCNE